MNKKQMKEQKVTIDDEHTECTGKTAYYQGLAVVNLDGIEYDVPFEFTSNWQEDDEYGEEHFTGIIRKNVCLSDGKDTKIAPKTLIKLENLVEEEFESR